MIDIGKTVEVFGLPPADWNEVLHDGAVGVVLEHRMSSISPDLHRVEFENGAAVVSGSWLREVTP
jgi:hypothetical protein